jgi:O-antigen/teichoic acid export membrane protein
VERKGTALHGVSVCRVRAARLGSFCRARVLKARWSALLPLLLIQGGAAGLACMISLGVARQLGPETFGEFSFALACGTYAAQCVRFGADRTLVHELVRLASDPKPILTTSLVLRSVVFGIVLMVAWPLASRFLENSVPFSLVILAVSLPALDFQAWYDARGEAAKHGLYSLVQRLLLFLVLQHPAFVATGKAGLLLTSQAWLGAGLVLLAFQGRCFLRVVSWVARDRFNSSLKQVPALFATNLPVFAAGLLCLSFGTLNQVLVFALAGSAEAGLFAAGWQYVAAVGLVAAQAARLAIPRLARVSCGGTTAPQFLVSLRKEALQLLLLTCPFALPALIVPEAVLGILFPGRDLDGVALLRCMALYSLLVSVGIMPGQVLVFLGQRRTYFTCVIAGVLLAVLTCTVLIPPWGALGGAISLLISHGFSILLYWIAVLRCCAAQ